MPSFLTKAAIAHNGIKPLANSLASGKKYPPKGGGLQAMARAKRKHTK